MKGFFRIRMSAGRVPRVRKMKFGLGPFKYKLVNWTSCAAHCLNLVFKIIFKLDHIVEFARRASKVTIFVYNHVALLSWLGKNK